MRGEAGLHRDRAMGSERVAIWGFHGYGSFGDDLVAGMIGLHLIERGAEVVTNRLCEPYARRFGLEVADGPDQLLDGAGLVVWAGGSTLESSLPPRGRFGLGAALPAHADEAGRLLAGAEERNVPIVGISIGGDGVYPRELYPPSKQRFLEQAEYISVRYEGDVRLLRESGTEGDFFPDLLWRAGPMFPKPEARSRREALRVGVSAYAGQLLPQRAVWAPPLLYSAAWARRDVEFVFFDSANASRNGFRALPRPPGARGRNRMFERPDDDLELLASLDLVITTHLPVGIAAMSYGVPFLSLAPDHRAARLMRDIGLERLLFRRRDARRLWSVLSSRERLASLIESFRVPGLAELHAESSGHLRAAEAALTRASRADPGR